MLFSSSKCPLPALVSWCRAIKYSISAGLPLVRIFRQQAKSGPKPLRAVAEDIAEKLAAGESFADALEAHRDRFPPLFVELVAVGEQTGKLEATFDELDRYYETSLHTQRKFRSLMAYPAIQFFAAIFIIAGLIFILGFIGEGKMSVFGLSGAGGAITFLCFTLGPVIALLMFLKLSADSVKWRAKMEGILLSVPAWGPALLMFATQRFVVALGMTAEAGLRAEKALGYSFRATANSRFQRGTDHAIAVVKRGGEIYDALEASGAPFPPDFREAIMVAEETGQMTEVCERLANNYREEGERRMKSASQMTAWAIYAMVAIMIIIAIFNIASIYIGALNSAAG
ncbi:MAG TPA: type II secretion system F family protein [Gemmataceae bacterium]|nr:type II secretion system F family protein [Gemmataceae bacterium]